MIDFLSIHSTDLNRTSYLIQQEFIRRGWNAEVAYVGSALITIHRPKAKIIRIFSSTPPTTTYASGLLANDKFATYQILHHIGVKQPGTTIVDDLTPEKDIVDYLAKYKKIVIKPLDGGHGKGITVNITTLNKAKKAIIFALSHNKSAKKVLLQEQIIKKPLNDIRLTCIDYTFVAALHRLPANVIGNGINSVGELIHLENSKPDRGVPYRSKLAFIDYAKAYEYLGKNVEIIPEAGESVNVLGIANYGAGGETHDITELIPEWLKTESERIAKAMELPVAGIDFLITNDLKSRFAKEYSYLVEVNKCPSLSMHDEPTKGINRQTVSKYCDYLSRI